MSRRRTTKPAAPAAALTGSAPAPAPSSSSSSSSSEPVQTQPANQNSSLAACVRERFGGSTIAMAWWLELISDHPSNTGLDSANTITEWATWYQSLDEDDFHNWEEDFTPRDKINLRHFSRMLQQYVPDFAGYIPQSVATSTSVSTGVSSATSGVVAVASGNTTSTLVNNTTSLRRTILSNAKKARNLLGSLPPLVDEEAYQSASTTIEFNRSGCGSIPTNATPPTDLSCISLGLNQAQVVIGRYVKELTNQMLATTTVGQDAELRAKCKRQLLALNKFSESTFVYYQNLYKFYYYICGLYPCLVHSPIRNDLLPLETIIQWIKREAYNVQNEVNGSASLSTEGVRQVFLWTEAHSLLNDILAMNLVAAYFGANQVHWPKTLLERIKQTLPQHFIGLKSANDHFLRSFTADGYIKRNLQDQSHLNLNGKRKRGNRGNGGGGRGRGRGRGGGGGGRGRGGGGGGGRDKAESHTSPPSTGSSSGSGS